MKKTITAIVCAALPVFAVFAEKVIVADSARNPDLDYWASADVKFCRAAMDIVFEKAGVEPEKAAYGKDAQLTGTNAEVICSAFRTPALLENYLFPYQPLGRMHYGLYASPLKAAEIMSVKITDWPRMRVGYSPVSQGSNNDREDYFKHATLRPEYVEYQTSAGAVEALHAGEIDALFLYTPFSKRPEGLVEVVPIGDRNVYFCVRKDRRELFKKLAATWRSVYIDDIDQIDAWRETLLGIPRPPNRVRIAAYSRGDIFEVSPDGERSGALAVWMRTICGHTRWTPDYVYGGYDESLEDVKNGRLDLIGGIGFTPSRRNLFHYPHTPIGMLRVYLWSRPGGKYKPGEPSTWDGMRVGMLVGALSGERAKRQFKDEGVKVEYVEYHTDKAMIESYFKGEIDACIDLEMPELAKEEALHLYASHPMYICASNKRQDIFDDLEHALDMVCDDLPKYMRMISEHHYGVHSEMSALTLNEAEWLNRRIKLDKPVMIDFSPWPYPIFDSHGHMQGFIGAFVTELSRKTGLKIIPQQQTGVQTAEAKFMRGETELWIPFPVVAKSATYGATQVFALPVPQIAAEFYGVGTDYVELEMFANKHVSPELVSVLRKAVTGIDSNYMQEMFMRAVAERKIVHTMFGMTQDELLQMITLAVCGVLCVIVMFGSVMMVALRRQTKRANAAAKLAEDHAQAKTRFLAMMSHELRTPLNAVIGFAEFMADKALPEDKREEYTDGILTSSNALLDLINDILDLSKLEAGAMQMRSGACDVSRLMKELPAIFGYRVRKHGVKLRIEAPPPEKLPIVELAQQGLRQILINLVGNAAKFTDHGEIAVKASWSGANNCLHIEVSDTGCGISQDKMDRLFDPFVQDIKSRMHANSGQMKGTGLGLPIVKRMVDSAGGMISAKSELGRGTTFVIDIPDLVVVQNVEMASASGEVVCGAVPERVLVVDDMVMNRKILGIHLEKLGVSDVRFAENGKNALEVMGQWLPDMVLTDMWMPEMDGTQLAEAMHRDRRLAQVPVVAVTADVDVGSTYDTSLFAKVVSKPVTGEKLKALFGEVAGK